MNANIYFANTNIGKEKGLKSFRVFLHLTKEEFDILLRAIDYYNYASSIFEYGEHIEACQGIRHQIIEKVRPLNFNSL